ncbi:hypothetical protein PT974_00378 [Cladobotryum mycophilum]|uniref:Uncharacterized protein n=1 Tax=Cladobotryum mycophilum TaxID=491253 RepID=A0ABR0T0P5_9HYPO
MISSIPLPRLQLSSQEKDLDLVLQTSLQIQFPEGHGAPSTSSELLDLVTEKHLWIGRTGSCHFKLLVSIQGEPISDDARVAQLAEWIQKYEFWHRLGLRLQYCETRFTWPPGELSFSIQHPDLSSALVPPADAFTADFRSVTCSVDISKVEKESSAPDGRRCKRRKCRQTEARVEREETKDTVDEELYTSLIFEDQRAIDEFMLGWGVDSAASEGKALKERKHENEDKGMYLSEQVRRMLEVTLRVLVLGNGKPLKGVRVRESTVSQALTKLAPAVFHIPYLKVVSDQASFLPIIATSLARMRNAESPSLRQKVASLRITSTTKGIDSGDADMIVRGVEKSAWNVLLATIKKPAMRARSKLGRTRDEDNRDFTGSKDAQDLLMEQPRIEASQSTDTEQRIEIQPSMWLDSTNYGQLFVGEDPRLRASTGAIQSNCDTERSNHGTSCPVTPCISVSSPALERTSQWRASAPSNLAALPMQSYQPMTPTYSVMGRNNDYQVYHTSEMYENHTPLQLLTERHDLWAPNLDLAGNHQLVDGFEAKNTTVAYNPSTDPAFFSTFDDWLSSETCAKREAGIWELVNMVGGI